MSFLQTEYIRIQRNTFRELKRLAHLGDLSAFDDAIAAILDRDYMAQVQAAKDVISDRMVKARMQGDVSGYDYYLGLYRHLLDNSY